MHINSLKRWRTTWKSSDSIQPPTLGSTEKGNRAVKRIDLKHILEYMHIFKNSIKYIEDSNQNKKRKMNAAEKPFITSKKYLIK